MLLHITDVLFLDPGIKQEQRRTFSEHQGNIEDIFQRHKSCKMEGSKGISKSIEDKIIKTTNKGNDQSESSV